MYTGNFWMNVPHSIWKALSSKAFIFHSVSLSESQLCFSGRVSLSTWHSADNWKQHVSGTLFEILEHMKFLLSLRENLHLVRMVRHGNRLPREVEASHLWKYLKPSWMGSQLALADPDWASGGIGPFHPQLIWILMSLFKLSSTKNYYLQQTKLFAGALLYKAGKRFEAMAAAQAPIWWVGWTWKAYKRRKLLHVWFGRDEEGLFPQQSLMFPQMHSRSGPDTSLWFNYILTLWLKRTMKSIILQSVAINSTWVE